MWISKKKYNELIEQKDNYERIASGTIQLNSRIMESNARILEEMTGIQELNHRLQQCNEELLAYCQELEQKCHSVADARDMWSQEFEELDIAYGELAIQNERLTEERDFYADKVAYLEGEVEDLEERVAAFVEGKAISREAE